MSDNTRPHETGAEMPAEPPVALLTIFQWLSAAAGIIAGLKTILDDSGIDDKLDAVLTDLQQLRQELIRAAADVLEAIDGIRREINENTANDNITLADVALFNDLAVFGDTQTAMRHSFEAANRLALENDESFVTSFIYVVNIRLAVLKEFDENYFCVDQFRNEFRQYRGRLQDWIDTFNNMIIRSHKAGVVPWMVRTPGGLIITSGWEATHRRNGVVVRFERGPRRDTSEATRQRLLKLVNESRTRGISADRQGFGVVGMETTHRAWVEAFDTNRRLALVQQVLGRAPMAVDYRADGGLLVDGRVLPEALDLRSTLLELLTSREFRRRIDDVWNRFLDEEDDQLAHLAHQRLFGRRATDGELATLRQVGAMYGYHAFVGVLLRSTEYERRYGKGLPPGGKPLLRELGL